jgi:hypothetical protein
MRAGPIGGFCLGAFALALAACGPAHPPGAASAPSAGDACPMLDDAKTIFGQDFLAEDRAPIGDMAGACHWESKSGALQGEMILYTAASLARGDAKTARGRYDDRVAAWKGMAEEAPLPLPGLGDEASLWTGFAGGQAQIAALKGGAALLVMANSTDKAISSPDLAKRMAAALLKKLP